MTKAIFTLCITLNGNSHPLHFEDYSTLLATRAALVDAALPGMTFTEDEATRTCFMSPETALAHATLWAESIKGHAITLAVEGTMAAMVAGPEVVKAPVKAKRKPGTVASPDGETRADWIMRMLTGPGITLKQIVKHTGIRPNSASALVSTATRKRGYVATLKDGVYTAAPKPKPRRSSRVAGASEASRDSRPSTH